MNKNVFRDYLDDIIIYFYDNVIISRSIHKLMDFMSREIEKTNRSSKENYSKEEVEEMQRKYYIKIKEHNRE